MSHPTSVTATTYLSQDGTGSQVDLSSSRSPLHSAQPAHAMRKGVRFGLNPEKACTLPQPREQRVVVQLLALKKDSLVPHREEISK